MAGPRTIARTRSGTPADGSSLTPEGVDPGRRIVGIDIARGLAILGMFTVHVQFFGTGGEASAERQAHCSRRPGDVRPCSSSSCRGCRCRSSPGGAQ